MNSNLILIYNLNNITSIYYNAEVIVNNLSNDTKYQKPIYVLDINIL